MVGLILADAHRHGINQVLTNWADGVAGITQCSLNKGDSYTYEFTLIDQVGTYFWHAHVSWLRATVYGAFIIHPKGPLPYATPAAEIPIVFGTLNLILSEMIELESTRVIALYIQVY